MLQQTSTLEVRLTNLINSKESELQSIIEQIDDVDLITAGLAEKRARLLTKKQQLEGQVSELTELADDTCDNDTPSYSRLGEGRLKTLFTSKDKRAIKKDQPSKIAMVATAVEMANTRLNGDGPFTFTVADVVLATGIEQKTVSPALQGLSDQGLLEVIGYQASPLGGKARRVYRVIGGVS